MKEELRGYIITAKYENGSEMKLVIDNPHTIGGYLSQLKERFTDVFLTKTGNYMYQSNFFRFVGEPVELSIERVVRVGKYPTTEYKLRGDQVLPILNDGSKEYCKEVADEMASPDRKLKQEDVTYGSRNYWVSTVFLVHDYNVVGDIPVLFETMVRDNDDSSKDDYIRRYFTYRDALGGHAELVEELKNGATTLEKLLRDNN